MQGAGSRDGELNLCEGRRQWWVSSLRLEMTAQGKEECDWTGHKVQCADPGNSQIRSRADRKSYGSFGPTSRPLPSLVAQHRPANLSFAQPLFPVQLLSYRIAALSVSLSPLLLPFSHHSLSRSSPDRQPLAHSRTALSLYFSSLGPLPTIVFSNLDAAGAASTINCLLPMMAALRQIMV